MNQAGLELLRFNPVQDIACPAGVDILIPVGHNLLRLGHKSRHDGLDGSPHMLLFITQYPPDRSIQNPLRQVLQNLNKAPSSNSHTSQLLILDVFPQSLRHSFNLRYFFVVHVQLETVQSSLHPYQEQLEDAGHSRLNWRRVDELLEAGGLRLPGGPLEGR